MCLGEVHSLCSLLGVVVLLTWCYVYYAAGSFTVWYVVLRGTCTVGRGFCYTAEFLLYRGHTVLYALCMWLLVLSVWWCILRCCMMSLLVCYVLVGKSLSVVLSWGGSLLFSRLGGVVGLFLWLGVSAGHQRFCWGLC